MNNKYSYSLLKEAKANQKYFTTEIGVTTPKFENTLQNTFITGPVGTGKTYKATQLLISAMESYNLTINGMTDKPGKDRFFIVSNPMLIRESRLSSNMLKESMRHLGIVDDLGIGLTTPNAIEPTYILINERLENNRPTVITSNLDLEDISRIDDRLASRLATFDYVELSGKDRRLQTK